MTNALDPDALAQEIQLCLNRAKLPTTHIACRTKIVEKGGMYSVATLIMPMNPDADNRSFTLLAPLHNGDTVMSLATELATRFLEAINGDDYERASADSYALGLH